MQSRTIEKQFSPIIDWAWEYGTNRTEKFTTTASGKRKNCDIKFSDFYKIDLFISVGSLSLSHFVVTLPQNTALALRSVFFFCSVCVFLYFLLRHNTQINLIVSHNCVCFVFSCMFVVHFYMQHFSFVSLLFSGLLSFYFSCKNQRD